MNVLNVNIYMQLEQILIKLWINFKKNFKIYLNTKIYDNNSGK